MRQSQKSNRSRGRGSRKGGGGGGGGGGGNNLNRVYDSAGPEGKVRGTPQQIIDKYLTLARDAQTAGDRVTAENFLQHAEHYQRIVIAAMSDQERARREATQQATDDDEDGDYSSSPLPVAETSQQNREPAPQRKASSDAIDGMATIDTDAAAEPESLVVATEELTNSQPRPNGGARRSRRRTPRAEDDGAAQGGSETAEQAPEGAQVEG